MTEGNMPTRFGSLLFGGIGGLLVALLFFAVLFLFGSARFHSLSLTSSPPIGGVTPATYSRTIPVGQRVIDQFHVPVPGCYWGIFSDDTPPTYNVGNELLRHIQVSPTSIPAKVGQPFDLTYDASYLCKGQTITNQNYTPWNFDQDLKDVNTPVDGGWVEIGTVYWGDTGSIEGLTRSYGVLRHTYPSPGPRTILIQLNFACIDYGDRTCPPVPPYRRSISVPANVTP